MLQTQFEEKGYNSQALEETIDEIAHLEEWQLKRKTTKNEPCTGNNIAFITTYNSQYRQVEKIISKHWNVLKTDPVLDAILPQKPQFIYKRAPNLRQDIVKNAVDQPTSTLKKEGGFSRCGRCVGCKTTGGLKPPTRSFISTTTNHTYTCKFEGSCATQGVIYLLQCPCNLQYVGKTKRAFKVRLGEHIRNIKNGLPTHSVSDHFLKHHNRDPTKLWYSIIDVVRLNWRGGNPDRQLAQREMKWIYMLKTLHPAGLNLDIDLNCFIENY